VAVSVEAQWIWIAISGALAFAYVVIVSFRKVKSLFFRKNSNAISAVNPDAEGCSVSTYEAATCPSCLHRGSCVVMSQPNVRSSRPGKPDGGI